MNPWRLVRNAQKKSPWKGVPGVSLSPSPQLIFQWDLNLWMEKRWDFKGVGSQLGSNPSQTDENVSNSSWKKRGKSIINLCPKEQTPKAVRKEQILNHGSSHSVKFRSDPAQNCNWNPLSASKNWDWPKNWPRWPTAPGLSQLREGLGFPGYWGAGVWPGKGTGWSWRSLLT